MDLLPGVFFGKYVLLIIVIPATAMIIIMPIVFSLKITQVFYSMGQREQIKGLKPSQLAFYRR